jgi:hypothetical protein
MLLDYLAGEVQTSHALPRQPDVPTAVPFGC